MTSSSPRGEQVPVAKMMLGAAEAKAATSASVKVRPAVRRLASKNSHHTNYSQSPSDNYTTVQEDHGHITEEISKGDSTTLHPSIPTTEALLDVDCDSYLRLTHDNLRAFNDQICSSTARAHQDHMRKKTSPLKKNRKKAKEDRDSHPLNLPPDELRRLSAAIAREDGAKRSMDYDANEQGGAASPPASSAPPTPMNTAPGAYPDIGSSVNGAYPNGAKSPTPPLHRIPPKPSVDAEACKAAGNKFFKARDYSRAITEYSKAVEAEPSNPTYLSNRAAAYMSANQFSPALADSLKAAELDPTNPKTIHRLARIYTSLGRPREALDAYALIPGGASSKDTDTTKQMLQAIDAAESAIKDDKGSGQLALWNLDRADKFLGSTVTRPRKWLLLRAEAYLKIGTANALGEVQGISTSLMRDNPADADALVIRGRAFYQAGENDNAIKHFRQALAYDPDLVMARKLLKVVQKLDKAKEEGNSAFKSGRFARAVELYTEALEVDSNNKGTNAKILQNRAVARMKLKQFNEAISDCEQAIRLDPAYTKARKTRAKAVGESGNWDQAVKDLKELAEQHPEEPGIAKDVKDAEMELKKSKRKDYYKILGIDKDAGENEIKKAYRKQALVFHPDKNPGDEAAAEKFKDVGEAYECLSDPQKRERYNSGADLIDPAEMFGGGMPGGMGGGGMQIDPEMLFNMMGGMGGARAGRGGGGMPQFSFQTGGPAGGRGGFPF